MTTQHQQLEVSRVIRADRALVFLAWTDPKMIVQWWGAGGITCPTAEMDLTVGGSYRIANETADGTTMWVTGTFSQVDPPQRLTYSWAMEPLDADTVYSLVEVSFEDTPEGTLVTIVQSRIPSPEAREMHVQGWIGCLEGLDTLIGM